MTHKRIAILLILVLAVIGSLGDGSAEEVKGTVQADSLSVYAVEAESLTVINGVLIECANQANWPSSGGVLQEGN